ncbi:MAG: hypothetical protein Q9191_007947 [Dirinaria sp. TL-2023a]
MDTEHVSGARSIILNTPKTLPRSKEGMRRSLENKLLFATIRSQKVKFGNSHGKMLRALFGLKKRDFTTEQAYRDDDIKRRRGIEQIMVARAKAGLEKDGEHIKWREIAEVGDKFEELEGEHRAFIIAELEARVVRKTGMPAYAPVRLKELGTRRKAERRLLSDTVALPNYGGIPRKRLGWLNKALTHKELPAKAGKMDREDIKREQAVNYIAACRLKAGVWQEFESQYKNRKFFFENVKRMAVEDLERMIWPESEDKGEEDDANCSWSHGEDTSSDDGGVEVAPESESGQALTEKGEAGDGSAHSQDNSTTTLPIRPKSAERDEEFMQ